LLRWAKPSGTGGIEVLNILGLSDENFHIGAQHLNAFGDSQHPNCAKQGVGPFGSPIHQGQLHLWAHDGNDQTGYSSSASKIDACCGGQGECFRKCSGVSNDFFQWGAAKRANTLGVAQHLQ
jgi:hypothetical protein